MTVVPQQRLSKRAWIIAAVVGTAILLYVTRRPPETPAPTAAPADAKLSTGNASVDADSTMAPASSIAPWPTSRSDITSTRPLADAEPDVLTGGADPDEPDTDPYEINEPILMAPDDGRISSSFDESLVTAAEDDSSEPDSDDDASDGDDTPVGRSPAR